MTPVTKTSDRATEGTHSLNLYNSYLCARVVIPFILAVGLVDVPAGVTQEEGHTGFLHLASAVLLVIFIARRIQPSLSHVDCEVERILCTHEIIVLHCLLGMIIFFCVCEGKSQFV